jgi:hypothetical protein
MSIFLAAIQKAPDPIPDLRPPKGEINTNFPETMFFGAALLFSLVVLIFGRILHVRRPRLIGSTRSPIANFRRELAAIANSGSDPLDRSIHAVRNYVCDAFDVGSNGMTNEELIAEFREHSLAREESVVALHDFLVGNDLLRFAPLAGTSEDVLQRATELVEQLESRRVAALPPPLPVTS